MEEAQGHASVDDLPALSDTVVLAAFLGISVPTLNRWRAASIGPKWVKLGHHVRYPRERIREYLEAQEVA